MKFKSIVKERKRSSLGTLPILLLCFCLTLVSCSTSQSSVNDHSALLSQAVSEQVSKTDFFFFIIPHDASPALAQSAKELCETFCQKTSAAAQVHFDNEPLPTYKNPRFILIGNTAYESSHKAIAHLKHNDYVCVSIGRDVVIGGKSSSASILAIERFTKEVLPYFDLESKISDACSFEHFAEYPYESISINGFSLSDYTIVYPENSNKKEFELSFILREKLAALCGEYPNICSDMEIYLSERLICIGNCFNDTREEAQIICEGKSVKLLGSSQNILAQVVQAFLEMCESSDTLVLQDVLIVDALSYELDIKTVFSKGINNESDMEDIVKICKEIKQETPMLVCFDIPNDNVLEHYCKNLTEYEHIGNGLFVLKDKNDILFSETVEKISCADVRLGEGFDHRVVVADTRGQTDKSEITDAVEKRLSNEVATILFTVSDNNVPPSFNRNDIIFKSETANGDRKIYVNVFSPTGAAYMQDETVIINHSLLQEALSLNE